jgi:hypothetical protein
MRAALRGLLWVCLGGWIGAWAFFAFAVAPTAFRVLPSSELAGDLVGPLLATLHLSGAGAGIALAVLAAALHRRGLLVVLPLALSAICLVSHFGVSAAIVQVRPENLGPGTAPEAAARFAQLHRISVLLYATVGLGALLLAALHAREDAPS